MTCYFDYVNLTLISISEYFASQLGYSWVWWMYVYPILTQALHSVFKLSLPTFWLKFCTWSSSFLCLLF